MRRCLHCFRFHTNPDWTCPECGTHPEFRDGFPLFAPGLAEANDGWSADFSDRLARDEEKHFWFVNRNRLIVWAVRKYFPNPDRYFELGCGTGVVLSALQKAFPQTSFSAGDVTLRGLSYARKRAPGAEILQLDARRLPYVSEFDLVGAFDVLEHIEEDEAVLSEIARALGDRGGLLVTVPQHPALWSVVDDFSFHKRRYTRKELIGKVRRAGFEVLRCASFASLTLPLLILSRLRMPKRVEDFDPASEYRIGSFANGVLGRVLGVERLAVRLGMNFPLGSSLVLAARKL